MIHAGENYQLVLTASTLLAERQLQRAKRGESRGAGHPPTNAAPQPPRGGFHFFFGIF